jgi:hypothetical protein
MELFRIEPYLSFLIYKIQSDSVQFFSFSKGKGREKEETKRKTVNDSKNFRFK